MTKKLFRISREAVQKILKPSKSAFRVIEGLESEDKLLSWRYDQSVDQFILLFGKDGDMENVQAEECYVVLETIEPERILPKQ